MSIRIERLFGRAAAGRTRARRVRHVGSQYHEANQRMNSSGRGGALRGRPEMDDDLWSFWERIIAEQGVIIDRSKGTAHPRFAEMIYPVDYGYLKNTTGGDGNEIDIFVGSTDSGLVGLLATKDSAKEDREIKLLWNLTDDEVEAATAFLNRETM